MERLGNFLGSLGFHLFPLCSARCQIDRRELSSAVEELRHRLSWGRGPPDVTGIKTNGLLEVIASPLETGGRRRSQNSFRFI